MFDEKEVLKQMIKKLENDLKIYKQCIKERYNTEQTIKFYEWEIYETETKLGVLKKCEKLW